jgi:rod shape-determining protein MreD
MSNVLVTNGLRFVFLVLVQVVLFNHINLFGYVNPLIYISAVLLFPIKKNKTALLLYSFLLGLSIDFFSNSGGINAAATVFIAFIRLPVLEVILGRSDFDYQLFKLRSIAFEKALFYIIILTFTHHFIVFTLAYFDFNLIKSIFKSSIITSTFTVIIIVIGIILFTRRK